MTRQSPLFCVSKTHSLSCSFPPFHLAAFGSCDVHWNRYWSVDFGVLKRSLEACCQLGRPTRLLTWLLLRSCLSLSGWALYVSTIIHEIKHWYPSCDLYNNNINSYSIKHRYNIILYISNYGWFISWFNSAKIRTKILGCHIVSAPTVPLQTCGEINIHSKSPSGYRVYHFLLFVGVKYESLLAVVMTIILCFSIAGRVFMLLLLFVL